MKKSFIHQHTCWYGKDKEPEENKGRKDSAYQPCCYLILSSPANFRRVIRLNARIVFIAWNRQCVDANIVESTGVNGDERWKFSFNTYFRTVC